MATPSITAGQVLGHYRLIEKIGGGGQGEVYRAHDERFDRDVALKILPFKLLPNEAARRRFQKEALAVGKLNHPNIATAYYFGEENGVDFLVTEYVAGVGLDDKLAQGAVPDETVLKLGIQLASGLEAAHCEGIVHRDLKPGNLRITQDGHLKILDFGLAELLGPTGDVSSAQTVTVNMTLTGTIPYMAPEQFGGICDQRADLWAAGAVLYEMATGKLPFPETQIQELREAIQRKEPILPRQVNSAISAGLEQVILRCLRKNLNQRYQSATALREDLERLATGRKTKEHETRQARRFAIGALLTVLLVSAVTVAYHWPEIHNRLWPTSVEKAEQFRLMAILPIETTTQSSPDDALVRGMAETVTAWIAQATNTQKLQVIPPSELIAQNVRTTEAARREFGAERVLEVSVQRSGDKVRVTCSLIDSKTHKLLKACSVTRDSSDLFALQDELATDVIAMLPPELRNERGAPTEVHAGPPEGYEAYLRGRGYLLEYQKPENLDAAIKEFQEALKASSNYPPALAGLGEAYWQKYKLTHSRNWLATAMDKCNQAVAGNPQLPDGLVCLGNVYRLRGEYELAQSQLELALKTSPENTQAMLALADTYANQHKTEEAEREFNKAIELNPKYWAVYNWAGNFFFQQSRYPEAENMFRKAVELKPGNQRALYNLAAIYLLKGRYQDAIDASQHSIDLRPTVQAYSNLGTAYFYLHRYPDAITAYEKAREFDTKDYLNWGNLGDALYWSLQRRQEAPAAYKQATQLAQAQLEVNPKDADTLAFLAGYQAMLGEKTTALAQIEKAQQLDPQNSDVMFRSAIVYNQLGDQRLTLEWLQKAAAAKFSQATIRDTPDFDHLKSDPAFKAIASGV
jgi:serine/threonine protein kinase/tetratricopeptide (TPR) repeat protein